MNGEEWGVRSDCIRFALHYANVNPFRCVTHLSTDSAIFGVSHVPCIQIKVRL